MVVPARAISSTMNAELVCRWGTAIALPTSPQWGCATIAAIGYAKKGIVNQMKMRSAER